MCAALFPCFYEVASSQANVSIAFATNSSIVRSTWGKETTANFAERRTRQPVANGVRRHMRRQYLDRHFASQSDIPRSIHFAHAASTEGHADFIGAKVCTWSKGHNWPRL